MLLVSSEFSVPPGFRFQPTKEEILFSYLKPAIEGQLLPSDVLREGDIYGENREPWKLFDKEARDSFWVFTKLKKKSRAKIDRTAGCGCWHGRSITEVRDAEDELVGFDKYFTFTVKKDHSEGLSCQDNGSWVMHEFSLSEEGFKDFAVCEIRNKDSNQVEVQEKSKIKREINNKRKSKTPVVDDDEEETMSVVPATKKACHEADNEWNDIGSFSLTNYYEQVIDFGELDHQESHNPVLESCCSSLQSPQDDIQDFQDLATASVYSNLNEVTDLEAFGQALDWNDCDMEAMLQLCNSNYYEQNVIEGLGLQDLY